MTKYICLLITAALINSDYLVYERFCQLVDEHVVMDFSDESKRFDNGYRQERYHQVLDTVLEVFTPIIESRGGSFHIRRDWSDGAVNAWAERWGDRYIIEVPGGMARYYLINEEGFLTTICHELGHLLGGSPHRYTISYEGQADYFAPMKCMEELLYALEYSPAQNGQDYPSNCYGDYCQARFSGISSLTSYYAELERSPAPRLDTPSHDRPSSTLRSHPPAQCRFDTMVAALKCSNREDFSYSSPLPGSCQDDASRPRCWFL